MRNSSGLKSKLLCGDPATSRHIFAKWLCTGEISTRAPLTLSVKRQCPGPHIRPTEPAEGQTGFCPTEAYFKQLWSTVSFRSTAYSLPPRDTAEVESHWGWDFIPQVIMQMSEYSRGQFCKFKLDVQTMQVIWSEQSGFIFFPQECKLKGSN